MLAKYGEDTSALFGLGVQGLQANGSSNGNGLYLVAKCAAALGGTPSLRYFKEEVRAEFELPISEADATILPSNICIASVDDDYITRKCDLQAFLELGAIAHVQGATVEEIKQFPKFVSLLDPKPSIVILGELCAQPSCHPPQYKCARA
jgi:hypothetical protein